MIGDGMGLAQLCAGYAYNQDFLNIFKYAKVVGLSNTSSDDDFITDSAAGATAISTGHKTHNGMIGYLPDSSSQTTIFEMAKKKKMTTGLVVTCALTHATPASFYAHQTNREMHKEIAQDFENGAVNIAVGGALHLFDTAKLAKQGYTIAVGQANIDEAKGNYLGFYDTSFHPKKISEGRGPFLGQNSMQAINNLENKNGFILMIEGSQIDWAGHSNEGDYLIQEMLDFDSCVGEVLRWSIANGETLVIITADHETGGLGLMQNGEENHTDKPALQFHNKHHSGIMVPVFAYGPGSEEFAGVYQNTEIFYKLKTLLKLP